MGYYVGEDIQRINARSVSNYDETSDDDNYQPALSLTMEHVNLV